MMVVIVEFELRAGAESKFESALKHMREQVRKYDGFLGEAPCRSVDNERKFVSLFYWQDRQSIKAWREDPEHVKIQQLGAKKYSPCTRNGHDQGLDISRFGWLSYNLANILLCLTDINDNSNLPKRRVR